jgi:hypothetical protein
MIKQQIAIKMVQYASDILGLSEIEVHFKPKSFFHYDEVSAIFNEKLYYIIFNEDWMALALPEEIVLTAFHETRHAYQKANIDFPQFFVGKETEETINQWKKDFENYNKPHEHNLSDYASQSIEKDATDFAWKVINEYFDPKLEF